MQHSKLFPNSEISTLWSTNIAPASKIALIDEYFRKISST